MVGSGRRAFSLVELLVVIAIVALLVGLLVPALSEARQAARNARSLANIRANAQVAVVYAVDNKDAFPNPFNLKDDPTLPNRPNQDWVWVPGKEGTTGWAYGESMGFSSSGTETYGYHWLAHLLWADDAGSSRIESLCAPGDRALREWYKTNTDHNAQNDFTWIFPTSYWYAPVFWQSPERFSTQFIRPATRANNYYIRRNRVSDCQSPNKKVLLFENRDFESAAQPMWNEPRARPNVALVDGSASRIRISRIIEATSTTIEAAPGSLEMPSGRWQPGLDEMDRHFLYGPRQGFDWQMGLPAYFWRTRNGIYGRDLP